MWAPQRVQKFIHSLPYIACQLLIGGTLPSAQGLGFFHPVLLPCPTGTEPANSGLERVLMLEFPSYLTLKASAQKDISLGLMIQKVSWSRLGDSILKLILLQQAQVGTFLRNCQSGAFKQATLAYLFLQICNHLELHFLQH